MSYSIKLEYLKNAILSVSGAQKIGAKSPRKENSGKYYISDINPDSKFIAMQFMVLFRFVFSKL